MIDITLFDPLRWCHLNIDVNDFIGTYYSVNCPRQMRKTLRAPNYKDYSLLDMDE